MKSEFAELRRQNLTKQLPEEQLKQRIAEFLKSQNLCVLCTSKDDVPRATPIEYYSEGTTIYMIASPTGNKVKNIKANPRVSVGIYSIPYTDWSDWYNAKGAQITGKATLLTTDNPEYFHAFEVYQWKPYYKAREWDTDNIPRGLTIINIEAQKIEYLELALMREGYRSSQVWEA